jgi:PTS system cellobiose-specific IIB component
METDFPFGLTCYQNPSKFRDLNPEKSAYPLDFDIITLLCVAMETGFRMISNHPRNNFLHSRMVKMFRIMLCCSAGMSTSLLVRKMVEEAEQRNLPVEIDAYGVAEFDAVSAIPGRASRTASEIYVKHAVRKGRRRRYPVQPINPMDYGMQRGDKVLDYALSLIEAAH